MIGMCGEFPADQLNRLIPSASYAEKLTSDEVRLGIAGQIALEA